MLTIGHYYQYALNIMPQRSATAIVSVLPHEVLNWILHVVSTYHKSKEDIEYEYRQILKCQENPEFFAPIYERYYESVFVFINKRVNAEEITADLSARTFYKCLNNIHKYKYQGVPFSAWLYKIALNEVNQFFRKQKSMLRTVSLEESQVEPLIEEIQSEAPIMDPNILLSTLLEQLEDGEVQFLELRFFENRSFKEVGYLLGMTANNAKVKTYRILKKLKSISSSIQYH